MDLGYTQIKDQLFRRTKRPTEGRSRVRHRLRPQVWPVRTRSEPEVIGLERLDTIMIAVILLERLFWNEAEDEWSG